MAARTPAIVSADGSAIVFVSNASNLVAAVATGDVDHVYLMQFETE